MPPLTWIKGREVAASAYIVDSTVVDRSEKIFSNLFQIDRIPAALSQYSVSPPLDELSTIAVQEHWPVYVVNASHILAFERPPATITTEHKFEFESAVSWRDSEKISNIPSENIAKSILKRSLYVHCLRRGLKRHPEINSIFFPRGIIQNDRLKSRDQYGKANWFLVSGERTKIRSKYRYFLCPTFRIRSDIGDAWFIQLGIKLLITDENNVILSKASAFSRRKDICSNWWNSEWLKRVLGIMQYLSVGQDTLQIGQYSRDQIEVSTCPHVLYATVGIDEERLTKLKEADAKVLMSSPLDEDED